MNPTSSEENLVTTPKLDTSPVTTVTYISIPSVPQVTSSTSCCIIGSTTLIELHAK